MGCGSVGRILRKERGRDGGHDGESEESSGRKVCIP